MVRRACEARRWAAAVRVAEARSWRPGRYLSTFIPMLNSLCSCSLQLLTAGEGGVQGCRLLMNRDLIISIIGDMTYWVSWRASRAGLVPCLAARSKPQFARP